jgi:hypothetical protein
MPGGTAANRADRGPSRAARRGLAIALNSLNEQVLHGSLSGDGPAVAEDDVVDVLLDVRLSAIYRPPAPALGGP